jgi:hypothetical protein
MTDSAELEINFVTKAELKAEIARLEAGREVLLETNRWQAREIEKLRAALAYYAIPENSADDGERARKALAEQEK